MDPRTPRRHMALMASWRSGGAALLATALVCAVAGDQAAAATRVLRVCNGSTFRCPPGKFLPTIAGAIGLARPADWGLVWPGIYHERRRPEAGVLPPPP